VSVNYAVVIRCFSLLSSLFLAVIFPNYDGQNMSISAAEADSSRCFFVE